MDEYSAEVGRLQQALRDERTRLDGLDSDSPEHHEQAGEVLIATKAMLDYEYQVPVLRDTVRYGISRRIVYIAGGVATALVTGLGVLAAIDQVNRWYLAPVALTLTLTITLLGTEPGAGRGGHDVRVTAVVFAVLVVTLLALVMLRVISAYWQWAGLILLLLAFMLRGAAAEETPVAAGSGP